MRKAERGCSSLSANITGDDGVCSQGDLFEAVEWLEALPVELARWALERSRGSGRCGWAQNTSRGATAWRSASRKSARCTTTSPRRIEEGLELWSGASTKARGRSIASRWDDRSGDLLERKFPRRRALLNPGARGRNPTLWVAAEVDERLWKTYIELTEPKASGRSGIKKAELSRHTSGCVSLT